MSGITSLFQYDFMRNAFLAVLIITPLFGILGTMIVNNKMAFFSDALGHSALTGIAVGVVCGIPDTNLSMVIFGIVFALLLNMVKSKSTASTDTIISVFSSCCIAIGLAILSRGRQFQQIFQPVGRGYSQYYEERNRLSVVDLPGNHCILDFVL